MDANKQKLVGFMLMLPAAALVLYLLISMKFWLIAIAAVVFGSMAMVGYHMVKGASLKDAAKESVADVKDAVKKDEAK